MAEGALAIKVKYGQGFAGAIGFLGEMGAPFLDRLGGGGSRGWVPPERHK